ncbi:MAG TPA: RNA methyltransferase [Thermoanaerobaculia bacterium]|nr:RNA methyltransferase [Thermoanaerobaculia bacterium]
MSLGLIATCVLGLEEILEAELRALGVEEPERQRGAVAFTGSWKDCWRANWRLRTANRVLVELGSWEAADGPSLAAGARALVGGRVRAPGLVRSEVDVARLLHPDRSFAIQATSTASEVRDTRWAALSVKDGLVDGQRDSYGKRSSVDRADPDLHLRVRLHRDRATLLLDTSGEPLDRRGYRAVTTKAPVREQIAAACVLASGWDGQGPVVDPMCGSGTLLIEAAWLALGQAPGRLRRSWAFERLPAYDRKAFESVKKEPIPAAGPGVRLYGNDLSAEALSAAKTNLERAGVLGRAALTRGPAADVYPPQAEPPETPGLVLINPPHGERIGTDAERWKEVGDLLKQRFKGWKAAVLAGEDRGKQIGLRPRRRIPVMNGPLEGRILLFDLY